MIVEDDEIQELVPSPSEWQEFKGEILFYYEKADNDLCIHTHLKKEYIGSYDSELVF